MLNQDKLIIIEPPPDAGWITRLRFWNESFKVKRPLQAMPDILQPNEELYIVVGGNVNKGSLQTAMQALGVTTGSSASGFINMLPGLIVGGIGLSILWGGFALAAAAAQVSFIGAPLALIVILAAIACVVLIGIPIAPLYGSAIAVTDKRVMYIKKPWVGLEMRDFTYSQVSSISQDTGMMFATITIQLAGSGIQFTQILKEKSGPLMNVVRDNIDRPQTMSLDSASIEALANIANTSNPLSSPQGDGQSALVSGAPVSHVETLERLADLHDRGVLSDEEFEEEKTKALRGD